MNEGLDQNAETGNFEALLRHRGRLVPRFDASIDEEPSPQLDQLVLARGWSRRPSSASTWAARASAITSPRSRRCSSWLRASPRT